MSDGLHGAAGESERLSFSGSFHFISQLSFLVVPLFELIRGTRTLHVFISLCLCGLMETVKFEKKEISESF